MKSLFRALICFIVFQSFGFSQNESEVLKFDTKYYDALDKWVAFLNSEKDSTYTIGFVYLDQMAGFTFSLGDTFKIIKNKFIASNTINHETTSMIYRLEPNARLFAVLNPEQLAQLNLKEKPDWLHIYNDGEGTIEFLKNTGYHLNHVGGSEKALEPLLQAYDINPEYKGLAFELGFAYNATGQFDKAISVLEKAILNSKDELLYKELGYALINLKQTEKAGSVYKEGIKYAKTKEIKAEMAINMCSLLLHIKDKVKLNEWIKISKEYIDDNSPYKQHLNYFEIEMTKLD